MKLYFSPGACSFASRIALKEADLPFESELVDLKTKKTKSGDDYLKINPKGYVPALKLNDGKMLTECVAILQYIADRVPEKNLLPAWGQPERYEAIENLNFVATEVHKGLGTLFNPALPEEARKITKDRLALRLKFLDEKLGTSPYLMGNQFSLADAYLFTVLRWTPMVKVDLSQYTKLLGFMETIKQRPIIQEAIKEEGLPA